MKLLTKFLCLLLILIFITSPVPAGAKTNLAPPTEEPAPSEAEQAWLEMASKAQSFTVVLKAPSLAMFQAEGLSLRAQAMTPTAPPAINSPEATGYLQALQNDMDLFLASAGERIGRRLEADYRYVHVINGFSAQMSLEEASLLREDPKVREVYPNTVWGLDSDTSPQFIGADQVWSGNAVPDAVGKRGEGTRIAFVDTGINVSHPSFSDSTPGYTYPTPPGGYLGLCRTSHQCNNKLIGIYDMLWKVNGHAQIDHGPHLAGTAAGNPIDVTYEGIPIRISGIAPRSQILSYKVCDINGCPTEAVIAGIDQAVADGADVISLGASPQSGPPRDPWQDPTDLALLEAERYGVITTSSAGNNGPNADTVYRAAPWTLVTGNTDHGRILGYPVFAVGAGLTIDTIAYPAHEELAPPLTEKITFQRIFKDPNNLYGCNPWTGITTNRVALVKRGVCNFKEKLQNFKNANGGFVLVYNDMPGKPIEMGSDTGKVEIPAAMISLEHGTLLMEHGVPVGVDIDPLTAGSDPAWGDVLAESTARGPVSNNNLLKPDLVAPGQNILAAYAAPGAIGLQSGSTMASAQTAGAAAVMRSIYPNWSPSAIRSALIMTAKPGSKDFDGTPATALETGNGRLDLSKAALAGMVMDASPYEFAMADPNRGGDPRGLNIPSYQNSTCLGSCSFTRTFRNVANVATTYTLSADAGVGMQVTTTPSGAFTVPPGGSQQVTVTVNPAANTAEWQFARVILTTTGKFANGKEISNLAFSLAVQTKLNGSNLPAELRKTTPFANSQHVLKDVQFTNPITAFSATRYGLFPATIINFDLEKDPTPGKPYDDLSQVWTSQFTCPASLQRMVVEVLETSANDLDIYVGRGSTVQQTSEEARAAEAGRSTYLNIPNPTFSGPCWVMVQNYDPSTAGAADAIKLAIAYVPRTITGIFNVSAPATVPRLQPFDVTINYRLDRFDQPDVWAWYGYMTLGSSPSTPADIGAVDVNFYKTTKSESIFLPLVTR